MQEEARYHENVCARIATVSSLQQLVVEQGAVAPQNDDSSAENAPLAYGSSSDEEPEDAASTATTPCDGRSIVALAATATAQRKTG